MTYNVMFTRDFSAAHKLYFPYTGKCANIHGHNYHVNVQIFAEDLTKEGFVVAFDTVKEQIDRLDHALIMNETDPLCKMLKGQVNVVQMLANPTTEYLARVLASNIFRAARAENRSVTSVYLSLNETDHISATADVEGEEVGTL